MKFGERIQIITKTFIPVVDNNAIANLMKYAYRGLIHVTKTANIKAKKLSSLQLCVRPNI